MALRATSRPSRHPPSFSLSSTHTNTSQIPLPSPPLLEQERYIESRALARATRFREALRLKQGIVARFADQVTFHDGSSPTTSFSSASSSSSSSTSAKRVPISIPAPPAESKLRFRDGVVVASKGEKYLIEKITPDWDGGSRGKIKTKGKRGPGFV